MIKVLDHGYVKLIESWGAGQEGVDYSEPDHEVGIIEAARMSTGKGFQGWDKDEKLLTHLYVNKHNTPFEMAGMILEIKAPIFVFREWHRHRTQSYNEMSARYIPLPDENYFPAVERVLRGATTATTNKQAQGTSQFPITENTVAKDLEVLEALYTHAQESYKYLLTRGWPKELARLVVPVARYSRMRASANLRNWLAFLTLRLHPTAQWEIRQYAQAVEHMVRVTFPRTHKLFMEECLREFPAIE